MADARRQFALIGHQPATMGGGSGIAAKKDETVVAEAEGLKVLRGEWYLCEGILGAF